MVVLGVIGVLTLRLVFIMVTRAFMYVRVSLFLLNCEHNIFVCKKKKGDFQTSEESGWLA